MTNITILWNMFRMSVSLVSVVLSACPACFLSTMAPAAAN